MKLQVLVLCVLVLAVNESFASHANVSEPCQRCVAGATNASKRVSSAYRDFHLVREQICGQIPPAGQAACEQLVNGLQPALLGALNQPVQACYFALSFLTSFPMPTQISILSVDQYPVFLLGRALPSCVVLLTPSLPS